MTFEEFVATRKYCDLLKTDIGDYIDIPSGQQEVMGMLYNEHYYILDNDTTSNEWYLVLENDYYLSNDLYSLEKLLYNWCVSEIEYCE